MDIYISINFHSHLDNICCKALKMLGFIKRICNEFKLTSSIKTLYCAYVRSILEYGAVVWDPSTSCGKDQIERVQRKFLNYVAFILSIDHPPHDYTPILNKLGISSLVDRRKDANLKFLRLLIDGCIDSPVLLSMINFKVPFSAVRQIYPFFIPKCNTNYSENQPILRMMRMANSDPSFL
uniref:RNA-directed DNA polymerase n=1 Tax=Schizaphis graminum TaxID=13262 RepID=A0A2S2P984_SCHGA